MFFPKLSGWFQLLIGISIGWVVGVFIYSGPWYRNPPTYTRLGVTRNIDLIEWNNFLLFGVLPAIIVWGTIWVVHGFQDTRNRSGKKNHKDRQEELDKKALF